MGDPLKWLYQDLAKYLVGGGSAIFIVILALIFFPDKVEKLVANLWRFACWLGFLGGKAHRLYLKHDIQSSVNDFLKGRIGQIPGFSADRVKLKWVDGEVKKQAFLEADQVVICMRKEVPHHDNFVNAVYFFVATSLLRHAKRYMSKSQGEATDLLVTAKLLKKEKPSFVESFLENYLHERLDDQPSKVSTYYQQLESIDGAGLFTPVFIQEMEYLGKKVFGSRKDQEVTKEVHSLIEHLYKIANRVVGDTSVPLTFVQKYCRFAVMIVGKPMKLLVSLDPYVAFIREAVQPSKVECLYMLGRADNRQAMLEIARRVSDAFDVVTQHAMSVKLRYPDHEEDAAGFLLLLRSKDNDLLSSTR